MLEWGKCCKNQAYQKFSYISVQWGSLHISVHQLQPLFPDHVSVVLKLDRMGKRDMTSRSCQVTVFWCLSTWVSVCVCEPVYECGIAHVCLSVSVCECWICVTACVCLSVCVTVYKCVWVCECVSVCVRLHEYECEWVCVNVYMSVSVSECDYVWMAMSVRECI